MLDHSPETTVFRLAVLDLAASSGAYVRATDAAEARELVKRATWAGEAQRQGPFPVANFGSPWALPHLSTCEPAECPYPLRPGQVIGLDGRPLGFDDE